MRLSRLIVAAPSFGAAVILGWGGIAFLFGPMRWTEGYRTLSYWFAYEMMAALFAIALPFALTASAIAHRIVPLGRNRMLYGTLVLLAPFLFVGFQMAPRSIRLWLLLEFLALAAARVFVYRVETERFKLGLTQIAHSLRNFGKAWTAFTASFLLFGILVVPALDLFGPRIPGDDMRQGHIMICMGALYFLVQGVFELIDLEGILRRAREKANRSEPIALPTVEVIPDEVRARYVDAAFGRKRGSRGSRAGAAEAGETRRRGASQDRRHSSRQG